MALALLATLVACENTPNEGLTTPGDPTAGLEDPAPELVKSGEILDCELDWELYTDGTLYVKGTGPMSEFEVNSGVSTRQPWQEYIANNSGYTIKKVVVEDGVTSLSEGAFQGCINLESVEIASSVTVLPYKCFDRCALLRTIRAKGVVEVHSDAFCACAKLTTVTLSASLQVVEDGAFLETAAQSTLAVRLAGNAEEWAAAQASEGFYMGEGNDVFEAALSNVRFVGK